MKIAVVNFSGNVGKTTVARHLLQPRISGAKLIAVESINGNDDPTPALRGRQFGELQEYLHTVDHAIVDIGASNVEDMLGLMRKYRGSQADFDVFVVPTVPALKQQKDTTATLIDLAEMGVPPARLRLLFNMVEQDVDIDRAFRPLLDFLSNHPIAAPDDRCRLASNDIFGRIKGTDTDLCDLAADTTDYKSLIAQAPVLHEKLALAQKLATRRLAQGILPELDACFEALHLGDSTPSPAESAP